MCAGWFWQAIWNWSKCVRHLGWLGGSFGWDCIRHCLRWPKHALETLHLARVLGTISRFHCLVKEECNNDALQHLWSQTVSAHPRSSYSSLSIWQVSWVNEWKFHIQSRSPLNCCLFQSSCVCQGPLCDISSYFKLHVGLQCHCLSYTSLCGSSIFCWAKAVQSAPSSSGWIALYVDVYLMCLWKELSSGFSYTAILTLFQINFEHDYKFVLLSSSKPEKPHHKLADSNLF